MNLYRISPEQVDEALARCNAGEYAGMMEFQRTDHEENRVGKRGQPLKRRYISGVLRMRSCEAVGALRYPHRRTRYADWQAHYDFVEQLLIQQGDAKITSRFRGRADYHGLLGFYMTAGRIKSARVQCSGVTTTYGEMPGNREAP